MQIMIGYLKGRVLARMAESITVEVGGIGWQAKVPLRCAAAEGSTVTLWVHTSFSSEQGTTLYGFETQEEKKLFVKLIGVSGLGPKTALQLMNLHTEELIGAIENADAARISAVKGVGKKTAARLLLELGGESIAASPTVAAESEAYEALKQLGFSHKEIHEKMKHAPKKHSSEELVGWWLKN